MTIALAPAALHPNEVILIASFATLGHTVNPEEYDGCAFDHAELMALSFNEPKKKDALHRQFERQKALVKGLRK